MTATSKTSVFTGLGRLIPTGRWLSALVTLMVAAVALYIVSLKLDLAAEREGRATDRAEVAEASAVALETASTARQSANQTRSTDRAAIAAETAVQREHLNEALTANPEWASQPVPAAVADSLR